MSERREEKEKKSEQKKGDGELLGELEKRESHRSVKLFGRYLVLFFYVFRY